MTEQAVDMEIPTEICTHEIKNDNLQHYFFRFRFFFSDASAATPISAFSLWSSFFANVLLDGKNEI